MEILGIERRKAFQYAGLFSFLLLVYGVGLWRYVRFVTSGGSVINTPFDLMQPIAGFCVVSALGFAALACYDESWESSEAAGVAVLAWTVAQRRQEIGIRLALGAEKRDVLWAVVRQGLALVVAGIAIGIVAGVFLTKLMSSALYKTSAHDLTTFAVAPIVFLGIAMVASYLPARRATKVDPLEAMREG